MTNHILCIYDVICYSEWRCLFFHCHLKVLSLLCTLGFHVHYFVHIYHLHLSPTFWQRGYRRVDGVTIFCSSLSVTEDTSTSDFPLPLSLLLAYRYCWHRGLVCWWRKKFWLWASIGEQCYLCWLHFLQSKCQWLVPSLGCFLNLVGFLRYDMGRLSDAVV